VKTASLSLPGHHELLNWAEKRVKAQLPKSVHLKACALNGLNTKDKGMLLYDFEATLVAALRPKEGITAPDMIDLAQALDYFGGAENKRKDTVVIEGMRFLIGDGDDSSAVRFKNGKVFIWLRHFGEGTRY
jgi:hypothetical protein